MKRSPIQRRRRPSTATLRKGRIVESDTGYRELAGIAAMRHGARCVVCQAAIVESVHHIVPRSQLGDDVLENLAPVCGSGTTGCHGLLEQRDPWASLRLLGWIHRNPDVHDYALRRKGAEWLSVRYCESSG